MAVVAVAVAFVVVLGCASALFISPLVQRPDPHRDANSTRHLQEALVVVVSLVVVAAEAVVEVAAAAVAVAHGRCWPRVRVGLESGWSGTSSSSSMAAPSATLAVLCARDRRLNRSGSDMVRQGGSR